jgi:hypothetical protein
MQPYFLPYLGYIALIKNVQKFVLLDEVQFIRHGWIERNRIINPRGEFTYIQVPLNKVDGRNTLIRHLTIRNNENWKQKILSQIEVYKKRAPNYYAIMGLVKKCLDFEGESIVDLNLHSLKCICEYLDIKTEIQVFSKMNLNIESPNAAGEWALNICKRIPSATDYWNPIGGVEIFDSRLYEEAKVKLSFFAINDYQYSQAELPFQRHLSIIDVLMFCKRDDVIEMLDNYCITEA